MTEKVNFLPLGSIVVVSGGIKKYVIVARALKVKINGKEQFFDYAACAYPEGMVGDRLMYFQHSDVSKVVFEGFSDDDEKMMCANIQKAMCIKNPATAGGQIFLWRIYKRNRFRELFLVGTDKKSEVPDTIKQSHTIK